MLSLSYHILLYSYIAGEYPRLLLGLRAHAEIMARTVSESVMASQSAHDVVIQARSAGEHSPADDHASITHKLQAAGATEKPNSLSNAPFDADHSQSSHPETVAGHSVNGVPADKLEPPYAEDTATIPNSADASGGSDTESRQDKDQANVRGDLGDKGHTRSNSMKRPASFKAVSVTKSFLAKASAGSSQPAKPASDKGLYSPLPIKPHRIILRLTKKPKLQLAHL
jgi:hypothetical protein